MEFCLHVGHKAYLLATKNNFHLQKTSIDIHVLCGFRSRESETPWMSGPECKKCVVVLERTCSTQCTCVLAFVTAR